MQVTVIVRRNLSALQVFVTTLKFVLVYYRKKVQWPMLFVMLGTAFRKQTRVYEYVCVNKRMHIPNEEKLNNLQLVSKTAISKTCSQ